MSDLEGRIAASMAEKDEQLSPIGAAMRRADAGQAPREARMRDETTVAWPSPAPGRLAAASPAETTRAGAVRVSIPVGDIPEAITYHRNRMAQIQKDAILRGAESERAIRAQEALIDELDRSYQERRADLSRALSRMRADLESALATFERLAEASAAALAKLDPDAARDVPINRPANKGE